jgi:hypothetical protein
VKRLKIITRAQAKVRGLTRYFSGRPCCHGHVAERYVCNYRCIECDNARMAAYFKTPEGKAAKRRYDQSPKGKALQRRQNSSPLGLERKRRFYRSPKGREANRRQQQTPKGIDAKFRFNQRWPDKQSQYDKKFRSTPSFRERAALYARERRLDRALDITRDDYDPVRAADLLARWNARR